MKTRIILLVCLLTGWLVQAMGEPAPRWLPLAEVLKKYEDKPLEAIQNAAEKGEATAAHYLGYAHTEGLRGPTNAQQAIAWYDRAINLGYLPSANNLGLLHFRGRIVPRDVEKALRHFRVAAEGGFPNAQAMLGSIYEAGDGVERNHVEAVKWFCRAVDSGHTEAMVHLGRHYRFGTGVPKDLREAAKWFRLAADRGEPTGMLNLGWLYGYEEHDQAAALKCFRDAAKQGLTEAMYELYLSYWNGKGVAEDRDEAKKFLKLAAEAGLAKAQYRLAGIYELDTTTWRSDPAEALRWFRKAAEQNLPGAKLKMAEYLLQGKVVEQDEERGLDLVRAVADQNFAPAVQQLAGLYASGIGEPRGPQDQPLPLLKRVTQLQEPGEDWGSQWAYEAIVFRYQYGLGTERDLIATAQWYCRGALAGVEFFSLEENPKDRSRLRVSESIVGTPDSRGWISMIRPEQESDDLLRVLRLYLRVAKANDAAAAMQFGERYLAGRDSPSDPVKAWAWFKVAAEKGAPEASARILAAEARLSSEQQTEANEALVELKADLQKLAATGLPSRDDSERR